VEELRRGAAVALVQARRRLAVADADLRAGRAALDGARRQHAAAAVEVATEAVAVAEEERRDAERLVALAGRRVVDREALAARFAASAPRVPGHGSFALPLDGQVRRTAADGSPITDPSSPLRPGETVTTGPDGAARLLLGGGEVDASLGAGTVMKLLEEGADGIEAALEQGFAQVRALAKRKLKGKFEVRTPTAICGIRGTAYRLEVREGKEVLTVTEGVVTVRPVGGGGPVLVSAGEQLRFGGTGPWPLPTRIPADPPSAGAR
jgi:ferric-dicitrate binding protein FerR (iron transport regulator)